MKQGSTNPATSFYLHFAFTSKKILFKKTKTSVMKQLLTFLCFILFLISCSSKNSGVNNDTIAVVERYEQAVQSKNADSMAALLSDDYMGYGPSFTDSLNK